MTAAIEQSRASPDQYAGALNLLRLYNSDDPDDRKRCLETLRAMEQEVSLDTGDASRHVRLADYSDLAADVEEGSLSRERAVEIAAARRVRQHRQQRAEQQSAQRSAQQQYEAAEQTASADLDRLGQELARDPDYARLYPAFTAVLRDTLRAAPPSQWAALARSTFAHLKTTLPAAPPVTSVPAGRGKPMRVNGSGNKTPEPKTMLEAVQQAIRDLDA